MAKSATVKKSVKKTSTAVVTVQDLEKEFGIEGRRIRQIIRGLGFKAPAANTPEGIFGPKSKYAWPEDSTDLRKIREALSEARTTESAKTKSVAKKKAKSRKQAEAEEDEAEEDEEEPEDDEEDEDEDEEDDE